MYSYIWNRAILRYCTDGSSNIVAKYQKEYCLKDPNFIVGDFDSITEHSKLYFKNKSQFIHAPNQDFTDFSKTLDQITQNPIFCNIDKILVLGGLCGRFDHALASLNSIVRFQKSILKSQIKIYLIDENNLITVTSTSDTIINIKSDMNDLTGKCGYMPIMQEKTVVTTNGFKWDLKEKEISFGGIISTSNEIDKDVLHVKTNQPIILYFEIKK